jgi:hypothetical protein
MKWEKCDQCKGKGYREAKGMVRIGSTHCGGVKEWCSKCGRKGKILVKEERDA